MAHKAPIRTLRSTEAAHYLGVAESTLRKSRVTGLLCCRSAPNYSKMGRTVIYSVAVLDTWLAELPTGNSTERTVA